MSLKALENNQEIVKILEKESNINEKTNIENSEEIKEENNDNELIEQLKQELKDWWNTYIFVKKYM